MPQNPTAMNLRSAAFCCWPSRISLSVMYCFQSGPFGQQITHSSTATINEEMLLLRACPMLDADVNGPGNNPDARSQFIIYRLCCQPSLILSNPHDCRCPLADSNSGIMGPARNFMSRHLDCIIICNDLFGPPEGITVHY